MQFQGDDMTTIAPNWTFRLACNGALAALCCAPAAAFAAGVPDVLGIKPGMTVEEAKAVLASQSQFKNLQVKSVNLAYTNSKGQTAPVPNAQTVGAIFNNDQGPGSTEKIAVEFGNVPGKERVVGVARYSLYGGDNRPLEDALRKSLVEKYGKPSYVDVTQVVIWSYDADGKARGVPVRGGFTPCNSSIATVGASGGGAFGNWSLGVFRPVIEYDRQRVTVNSLCGDVMVLARIVASGGFVNALHVQMMDHKGALAAREAAAKLIDAAAKAEMGDARKTAGKNAPKL
jgi:hypothetical protein